MNTISFLRKFNQKIQHWEKENKRRELFDSNRFNPFRFFRTNEVDLSAILVFLLNPNETHGQGELFLNAFLKKLNLHAFLAYDEVSVEIENSRRHDIFIQGKLNHKTAWVMCIENKLWGAADQPQQIERYLNDLLGYHQENYFILYLPANEQEPAFSSISQDKWNALKEANKATVWSAHKLVDWLSELVSVSPQMQSFIHYFNGFIKQDILHMNENTNQLAQEISKNGQEVKLALDLIAMQSEFYKVLMEKLCNDLQAKFEELYPDWEFKTDDFSMAKWYTPFALWSPNKLFCIYIEYDSSHLRDLNYGVYSENPKMREPSYQEKFALLRSRFEGSQEAKNGDRAEEIVDYPCWNWFDNDLCNWTSETWS